MEVQTRFDRVARIFHGTGLTAAAALIGGRRLTTLCYHGVTPRYPREDEFCVTGHLSLDLYRRQLEWLATHMRFIHLDELLGALSRGQKLPRRAVLITHDDAFLNNLEFALPALKEFGARPVFFVPTDPLDRPGTLLWYERIGYVVGWTKGAQLKVPDVSNGDWPIGTPKEREATNQKLFKRVSSLTAAARDDFAATLEELNAPVPLPDESRALFHAHMSWEQLAHIANDIDIGGHTSAHAALSHVSETEARREITANRERLTSKLGIAPRVFAYPFGSRDFFGGRDENLVREAGYEAAFSLVPLHTEPDTNPFALPRRNIFRISFEMFTSYASGLLDPILRRRG